VPQLDGQASDPHAFPSQAVSHPHAVWQSTAPQLCVAHMMSHEPGPQVTPSQVDWFVQSISQSSAKQSTALQALWPEQRTLQVAPPQSTPPWQLS
jgi:hypothetical protein